MRYLLKNIIFKILVLSAISCSSLEPVYNISDNETREILAEINVLPIEGRYGPILRNKLEQTFGGKKNNKKGAVYNLQGGVSVGASGAQSFNKDGTASRLEANISIDYVITDKKNCHIYSGSHLTTASFNAKTSGYDYGNIAARRAVFEKNIEYNVNNFYPQIYNAIKNKRPGYPFVPPYLSINNFRGCR